ncbi:DNA repair protein XRCC1 [Caerostris extrusa]|uniref:DNA repair protein XRCC1 n=1 Tax=Caerostris extrusa TaxID=172846 RepID=A0AAV4NIA4_CAEEX|nr:DNA repair protein XRCC1 [Caerostris extrusa]
MPEIKIKHVVSFSSEDKVHKAENILKSETYRKWKCASPGEKSASILLQFEKATQIHSIDIGNESSAFVEILVGRSSDTVSDYQVLLVASSFMSPLESRNENHTNRVRMFGPDKLTQKVKDEKWDYVQVICTQPFNKNITYGLSFIKFHSPPEKIEEKSIECETKNTSVKFGAFKLKYEDDDEADSSSIGSWLERKNKNSSNSLSSSQDSPSYATAILASVNSSQSSQQGNSSKRKLDSTEEQDKPPAKKESTVVHVNKDKVGYKNILGSKTDIASPSVKPKDTLKVKKNVVQKAINQSLNGMKASNSNKQDKVGGKKPFNKIMERVVLVISGFVNPLRGEIRDKALEMGAKYKGDWDNSCTHLICAFINTPKYLQVRGKGGRIVTKEWVLDCHKKKVLLDWKLYMLGNYSASSSDLSEEEGGSSEEWDGDDSSEEEMPIKKQKVKKPNSKTNVKQSSDTKNVAQRRPKSSSNSDSDELKQNAKKMKILSPQKKLPQSRNGIVKKANKSPAQNPPDIHNDDSETADEEALDDYMAATDVDSNSEGDTEDEIRKVKEKALKKAENVESLKKEESCDSDISLLPSKMDTTTLPLPELPNLFKQRHFFLYGEFSPKTYKDLQRYIIAYNGVLEDYMSNTVKYVVTESKWDENFEEALNNNDDLIFVKPDWVFKCHETGKQVPYQSYIVIPSS